MKLTKIGKTVLERVHLKDGEKPEEMFKRVAKAVSSVEEDKKLWERLFFDMMINLDFLPNTPTLINAGKPNGQLSACFVLPIEDDMSSIFTTLKNAALIHKTGGGTGFSFSRLRPKGDIVGSSMGIASGPLSFMEVFDKATDIVNQGGVRRGANMGILRVDHPDIEEFIEYKKDNTKLTNFNISVGVTDDFMERVINGDEFELINPRNKKVVKKVKAKDLFYKIVQSAWESGEPGMVFLDTINEYNLFRIDIESTNPCVTKDTWVMTKDGPYKVEQLIGKKDTVIVIDGNDYKTSGFFKTGNKETYIVETKEGYTIECTDNELFLTDKLEWVMCKDLKIGEKVTIYLYDNSWGNNNREEEEEGWLIGLFIGDGYFSDNDRPFISIYDVPGKDEICKKLNSIFFKNKHRYDFKGIRKVSIKNGINCKSRSIINSVWFKNLCKKYNILNTKSKNINRNIEQSSYKFHIGFLRGLFDTDGCVLYNNKNKSKSIRLTQNNINNLLSVQRMLLRLGINSRIYKNRRPEMSKLLPDGKGKYKNYHCKTYHELVISKKNIIRFNEIIGFTDTKKKTTLYNIINSYKNSPHNNKNVATISKITKTGKTKDVYDIIVDKIHMYNANGFVVHNCGEQPLLPYEPCNLGSINLSNMIDEHYNFMEYKFEETIKKATRFLDNVISVNHYPISEIKSMATMTRKIGLGVMGFHDMLIKKGISYNSKEAIKEAEDISFLLTKISHDESERIGKERGVPKACLDAGCKRRNLTTTTIAPTGSLSMIAGVSSGIEPIFSVSYKRKIVDENDEINVYHPLFEDIAKKYGITVDKNLIKNLPKKYRDVVITAHEIPPEQHLKIQAAFQKHIDNAVSKTINLPHEATVEDVKNIYTKAWDLGCKGITIYRDGSRTKQVLYKETKNKNSKTEIHMTHKESKNPRIRPDMTRGNTYRVKLGCGNLYVTINEDEYGMCEVFAQLGKAGGCAASQTEAVCRLISLCLRSGIKPDYVARQLKGIRCPNQHWSNGKLILSCADAIGNLLQPNKTNKKDQQYKSNVICPECGSYMIPDSGCFSCTSCGYTKCG